MFIILKINFSCSFLLFIMSKRARLSTEESKRAGLHAWETNDGRRWLMKALNPNDVAISSTGIPSLSSRNISVLNWQGEYTMGVPANLTATVPNYDVTLYLFQHPLIFGTSAARPQGTIDLRDFTGRFWLKAENAAGENPTSSTYTLSVAEAQSSSPLSLSSCNVFYNKQINPTAFSKSDTLAGKTALFKLLTEKNRICYGGATIIPTCSDQYNSGSMTVCQQIFNPRVSVMANNADIKLETYQENDFPDTSDAVQNPQMYYGKFQDGAYIPYKLVEPSSAEYKNSETATITRSPYWVTNVSLLVAPVPAASPDTTASTIESFETPVSQLPAGQSGGLHLTWSVPYTVTGAKPVGIRFTIVSYTGQKGYFTLSFADSDYNGVGSPSVFRATQTTDSALPCVATTTTSPTPWREGTNCIANTYSLWSNNTPATGIYFSLPREFTMYDIRTTQPLANGPGVHFVSQDTTDANSVGTYIPPYNGNELITVRMSGVSNTAPIKMILRYGVEILLTSSSIYSPFKFMSPKYDESAIKSYARCIRNMKDAYFANAGSTIGQVDFVNKILNLIETDAPDDMRVLNQGGQWTGVVGAY